MQLTELVELDVVLQAAYTPKQTSAGTSSVALEQWVQNVH